MLLSFPLDPDPSTSEIISEMIYANSTTLDGRRFASEFINKRKTDAQREIQIATQENEIQIASKSKQTSEKALNGQKNRPAIVR